MRCNRFAAAFAVLGLLCGTAKIAPAQADPLPISGQHITLAGTLKRVEAGTNAALFAGDDGRQYILDLSQAKIVLPGGAHLPLLAGTRGMVSGLGNPDGSITVSRFQAAPAAVVPAPVPVSADPPDVTVRGTVEAVDLEHGAFVLRINTHTRLVYVTPETDISTLGGASGQLSGASGQLSGASGQLSGASKQFPVQPGRRVTVGGSLQPNGAVLAGLLTAKEDANYLTAPDHPNRILFGTVSSPANKLGHRDIKIGLADGTETKVSVPRGIPVRRSGSQISVYDLSRRDSIRVTGRMSGTEFRAARIDVLTPLPDTAPADAPAEPAGKPGL